MLVQEFLEKSAERLPEKEVLIAGASRFSYKELNGHANRLGHVLKKAGVEYCDRVVVFLDNTPECVISIWGILKSDAVFVVVNPTAKPQKLKYIINNCRASALITHSSKWRALRDVVAEMPSLKAVILAGKGQPHTNNIRVPVIQWGEALSNVPATRPARKSIDVDLASLIYTSGTTGEPKGVMLTHRNMVAASSSITTYLENVESDIILNALPLSFDYGLYQVIMAAQFGGTVVLERSFLYPYAVIERLKKEKITGFPIVPTMLAVLFELENLGNERFEHLRYITNTAAALPVRHIEAVRRMFPEVKLYSMYGLTECKRVSYLPPEQIDIRPGSVGKGMPNEQVYLVDEKDVPVREPGVVGELVVRGANVSKGYWEKPEETAEILKPGRYPWERVLYTGDLFKMDAEGYLYFVSRKDDIIKSRGEKVSPKEVENVLYMLDEVAEAAVVGVPDKLLGEAVEAHVVLKEGSELTGKQILGHCRRNLEDFMVPKYVKFRNSLPKTSTGKITKKGL